MGIKSFLRLSLKLQDQFHVREMIPQAGIDGFAGIGKVLSLSRVKRPLTLAEVLLRSQVFNQPPHGTTLINKPVNTKWKSDILIHKLFTSTSPSSRQPLTFLCPAGGHPGWQNGLWWSPAGRVMEGRAERDHIVGRRNTEGSPHCLSEPRISAQRPVLPEQGPVRLPVQASTWMVPERTIQFECRVKTLSWTCSASLPQQVVGRFLAALAGAGECAAGYHFGSKASDAQSGVILNLMTHKYGGLAVRC